jgi:hypothetical protein
LLSKRFFIIAIISFSFLFAEAQSLPSDEGERARYSVQIDVKKAYISGICGMLFENGKLKASVVNEFGLSAMDFEYDSRKDKVKIINIIKKLDHWYIKRVLKRDLRILLHNLEQGIYKHENAKYEITYTFQPLQPITEEATDNGNTN